MNENLHARAERLISQDRIEGISHKERDWLAEHLRECQSCAQITQRTSDALRALRAVAIPLPRGLAGRTQFRVQLRAQELREREPKHRVLWLVCALSWGLGIASAPYVWQTLEWIGRYTGAPKLVLEFGFGLWWAVPALFAAAIVLLENVRQAKEKEWPGQ